MAYGLKKKAFYNKVLVQTIQRGGPAEVHAQPPEDRNFQPA
jgi:hypothetical protein